MGLVTDDIKVLATSREKPDLRRHLKNFSVEKNAFI
jgi:hypothetical protein